VAARASDRNRKINHHAHTCAYDPSPNPGSAGLGTACALAARYGLKAASVAGSATGPAALGRRAISGRGF
jgi:hypothetical protein